MTPQKDNPTPTPTDRELELLLDDALGHNADADRVTNHLADRIVTATEHRLPLPPAPRRLVIGTQRWHWPAAAALLLVTTWIGLSGLPGNGPATQRTESLPINTDDSEFAQLQNELDQFLAFQGYSPEFDDELTRLAQALDEQYADTDPIDSEDWLETLAAEAGL